MDSIWSPEELRRRVSLPVYAKRDEMACISLIAQLQTILSQKTQPSPTIMPDVRGGWGTILAYHDNNQPALRRRMDFYAGDCVLEGGALIIAVNMSKSTEIVIFKNRTGIPGRGCTITYGISPSDYAVFGPLTSYLSGSLLSASSGRVHFTRYFPQPNSFIGIIFSVVRRNDVVFRFSVTNRITDNGRLLFDSIDMLAIKKELVRLLKRAKLLIEDYGYNLRR